MPTLRPVARAESGGFKATAYSNGMVGIGCVSEQTQREMARYITAIAIARRDNTPVPTEEEFFAQRGV